MLPPRGVEEFTSSAFTVVFVKLFVVLEHIFVFLGEFWTNIASLGFHITVIGYFQVRKKANLNQHCEKKIIKRKKSIFSCFFKYVMRHR